MLHTHKELYKISGEKYYTWDYIIAHGIKRSKPGYHEIGKYTPCYAIRANSGEINIHTANGQIKGYVFGEKTWFDTREERDAYRAQQTAARENMIAKNKLLKQIMAHYETLTIEELQEVLTTL